MQRDTGALLCVFHESAGRRGMKRESCSDVPVKTAREPAENRSKLSKKASKLPGGYRLGGQRLFSFKGVV